MSEVKWWTVGDPADPGDFHSGAGDALEAALQGHAFAVARGWEEPYPRTLTLIGWREERPTAEDLADTIIEAMRDRLEYEGDSDPTDRLIEAARVFAAVALEEHPSWPVDEVSREEVDVRAWAAEHAPEWLEHLQEGDDA